LKTWCSSSSSSSSSCCCCCCFEDSVKSIGANKQVQFGFNSLNCICHYLHSDWWKKEKEKKRKISHCIATMWSRTTARVPRPISWTTLCITTIRSTNNFTVYYISN
jgi:hypothetical protein